MTETQKRTFLRGLCKAVLEGVMLCVADMPLEWDGIELREVMAERFDKERAKATLRGSRLRSYRAMKLAKRI